MKGMTAALAVAGLCVLLSAAEGVSQSTISDEALRSALTQARDLLNADKVDDAISLLEPLAPLAGDRLVYLPPGPSYALPRNAPAPPPVPTSVVQVLGAAYWGKRDAARALPYLEIVAARIPPDQDNLIPGTVLACREMLAGQGRTFPPASVINGNFATGVTDAGTLLVSAERIAVALGGELHRSQTSRGSELELLVGNKKVAFSLVSGTAAGGVDASGVLRAREINGMHWIPVRALAETLGGAVTWNPRLRLAFVTLRQARA